jgi:UDP-2-acetamido-3-amino-2,3-dideoxy-glucuronate N-acetyltransferase
MNFIDPSATIGEGTKVWHFAVILQDVKIGRDCNIGSHVEVGRGCVIGDRVRISSGVFLPPNARIGNDVFIGPQAVFTDDKFPRAGNKDYKAQPPVIEDGASIGAGAVILPGVVIRANAMIGAGSVVTREVHPHSVVRGLPARETFLYREC